MNPIIKEISDIGIVPVIALDSAKDAAPLAKALIEGGLPCAEVTFRTAAAKEAIQIISKQFPKMLVGAGTVLSTEQADEALAAGAKFIVSPGLNPKVVKYCLDKGVPVIPGCATPSDIEAALELGLEVVKFFPAEAAGGLPMIKALAAPYTTVKFMPTGGINPQNLAEYMSFKKIIACGGTWMVNKKLIKAGNFEEIRKLTAQAVEIMLGFQIGHVGINMQSEEDASKLADVFNRMPGLPKQDRGGAFFAGEAMEIMKTPRYAKNGHIAISTNSVERGVYHLQRLGFEFDWNSAGRNEDGSLRVIYLKGEFGGFSVHLLLKK